MESNQTLVSEKETIQLNSDEREECGDNGNSESQTSSSSSSLVNGEEIMKAIQVVERDSMAIAHSYTCLFASLRSALSEVTSTSVDHMNCFGDAAGRVQECALDAATKGNRYINSCLRLNEEMKGIDNLSTQLKIIRRNVDALDSAVNRLVRFP
ncbi:hypothetical protein BC332_00108 [Capsicum chinense]|uniref:BLOC-1-related complex subunit 6 C-terminal helix domain-containing protein n=1 Tax=Capsicum annuum TaxID=4072 RepID=A0A1U8GEM9_CAPAN|nr:hypothetical protein T459_00276 [Capsicum annuum]PHU28015.1 hypothetical protein BC332_00108 [Capsicum chinense]